MADTMLSFTDNSLSSFLSTDELRAKCPMAFKTAPTNPNVSERYLMATTETVINDLAKLGWYPVDAKQCRGKKGSKGIRSFHMIAFQNPDVKIVKPDGNGGEIVDSYPRIILENSHDGFNSFKFLCGCYRLVCSNGLVVASSEFANLSIRHINYTFDELRQIVAKTIENVPNVACTMSKMSTVTLTDEQKRQMATEVVRIRKNAEENEKFDIDEDTINDILKPIRKDDDKDDLWTVFNVCQEKLIRGGYNMRTGQNKSRKQRGITSIKKDLDYNQKLWAFASAMA